MARDGIEGKVALITGGGAGIGRAVAHEWAQRGGIAVVTDANEADAAAVAGEIENNGGRAMAHLLDVRDAGQIETVVASAAGVAGRLDVLFNVAGTNMPKNVTEMDDEDWYAILDTNLTSVYRCSKFAIPEMRKAGGGAIVNMGSTAGVMAENRCAAYTASKGGLMLLTRNMAMDFATDNIRVNAVCPGSTRTPRTESYWRKTGTGKSVIVDMCPMRRSAEPEEVARPAVFLASDDASYITGAALVVDGGLTSGIRIPTFDDL